MSPLASPFRSLTATDVGSWPTGMLVAGAKVSWPDAAGVDGTSTSPATQAATSVRASRLTECRLGLAIAAPIRRVRREPAGRGNANLDRGDYGIVTVVRGRSATALRPSRESRSTATRHGPGAIE